MSPWLTLWACEETRPERARLRSRLRHPESRPENPTRHPRLRQARCLAISPNSLDCFACEAWLRRQHPSALQITGAEEPRKSPGNIGDQKIQRSAETNKEQPLFPGRPRPLLMQKGGGNGRAA